MRETIWFDEERDAKRCQYLSSTRYTCRDIVVYSLCLHGLVVAKTFRRLSHDRPFHHYRSNVSARRFAAFSDPVSVVSVGRDSAVIATVVVDQTSARSSRKRGNRQLTEYFKANDVPGLCVCVCVRDSKGRRRGMARMLGRLSLARTRMSVRQSRLRVFENYN